MQPTNIDDNKSIELTDEMKLALEFAIESDSHIFITGKAGTGKTTFLRYLVSQLNKAKKNTVISAPTGIAAVNAQGVTLHSLFNIPFGPLNPETPPKENLSGFTIELLNKLDVLIIDEVSMVRPDVMDYINRKLQIYRMCSEPFGGIQVIMFGDLYQLPPVVKADESRFLKLWYDGFNFYNAKIFSEVGFYVVELNKVFRQNDEHFVGILNRIRECKTTEEDLEDLAELRDRKQLDNFETSVHICTHRADAIRINKEKLGFPTHIYEASIKDDFPENSMPCEMKLSLRVGARVMTLVNNKQLGYYNGSVGTVKEITDKGVVVDFDSGVTATVEQYTWEAYEYVYKDGKIEPEVKGSCMQMPLSLAYAITIHKSQGLTFDSAVIHIKRIFCPGQLYVALSRCRTMDKIYLDSFVKQRHLMMDEDLQKFEKRYRENEFYYQNEAL